MRPHIWRKRSNLTIVGYMWIVLNQADILKNTPTSSHNPRKSQRTLFRQEIDYEAEVRCWFT